MAARKSAEERLRRVFLVVTTVSVAVMIGLGFTSMRGPGAGFVLVFAAALATAAGIAWAVAHRRRQNRYWPPYRHPS